MTPPAPDPMPPSAAPGKLGVLVINFGEPREPTPEAVEPFLERIFLQNMSLEPNEEGRSRARFLAKERAPGLIEEYERIGGSPLNDQADAQAERLERILRERGADASCFSVFQYTAPFIADGVRAAVEAGVDRLVALPVYPICGQSTTVVALEEVEGALAELDDAPEFVGVSGWHHRPEYREMRAAHIRRFADERGLDPNAADTILHFSVHGTPIKYLDEGNRYDRYVDEHCRDIAARVGTESYSVGFQNHTNRRVQWTQPDNEDEIERRPESKLIVVPIAFMHEQSETLAELDHELREFTEGLGKEFHRVPVPHDDADFDAFLADLVEELATDPGASEVFPLAPCRCAPIDGVWCTNGARELPPSPYAVPVQPA